MPSNRNTRARRRAERETRHITILARDRGRRNAPDDADLLLRYLPERRRRDPAVGRAACALADAIRRTKLADPSRTYWPHDRRPTGTFLFGLSQVLRAHEFWIAAPDDWRPRTHNVHRQFAALARHLLCAYHVPSCLDEAWFMPRRSDRRRLQSWFRELGRGRSVRAVTGPTCPLTRRAAHLFATEAPGDLPVLHALRWSQLRAIGADARLVNALLGTCLTEDFAHDEFWMSVVRFFIAHPTLDRAQVGPVVDFIDDRRHRDHDGAGPVQPNFSMRGRSPKSLLRQVDRWHRALHGVGSAAYAPSIKWPPSGVRGLVRTEGRGKTKVAYEVRELLSSAELRAEGRAMHHCVASYAYRCRSRDVAIFTMTAADTDGRRRLLTIAVDPRSKTITEARGRFNARPTPVQMRIVTTWGQTAGLSIGRYL